MQRLAKIICKSYLVASSPDCLAFASPVLLLSLSSRMGAPAKDNRCLFNYDSCNVSPEANKSRLSEEIHTSGLGALPKTSCMGGGPTISEFMPEENSEDIGGALNAPLASASSPCLKAIQCVMKVSKAQRLDGSSNSNLPKPGTRRLKIDKHLAKFLFDGENELEYQLFNLTGNCLLGVGNYQPKKSWKPVPKFYSCGHNDVSVKSTMQSCMANVGEGLQRSTKKIMEKLKSVGSGSISDNMIDIDCPENPYYYCNALADCKDSLINSSSLKRNETSHAVMKSLHGIKQRSNLDENKPIELPKCTAPPSTKRVTRESDPKYWTLMQFFNKNRLVGIHPVDNTLLKSWGLGELIGSKKNAQEAVYAKILRVPIRFSLEEILEQKGRNSVKYLGKHLNVGLIAIGQNAELLGIVPFKSIAKKQHAVIQNELAEAVDAVATNLMIGCNLGSLTTASRPFEGSKPLEYSLGKRGYSKNPFSGAEEKGCIQNDMMTDLTERRKFRISPKRTMQRNPEGYEKRVLNLLLGVPGKPDLENTNLSKCATGPVKGNEELKDGMPVFTIAEFGGRSSCSDGKAEIGSNANICENTSGSSNDYRCGQASNVDPAGVSPMNNGSATNQQLNPGKTSAPRLNPCLFGADKASMTSHAQYSQSGFPQQCPLVCFPSNRARQQCDQGMIRFPRPCPHPCYSQAHLQQLGGRQASTPSHVAQFAFPPTTGLAPPVPFASSTSNSEGSYYSPHARLSESAQTLNFSSESSSKADEMQNYSNNVSPDNSTITSSNLGRVSSVGPIATTLGSESNTTFQTVPMMQSQVESVSDMQCCPWPNGYPCPQVGDSRATQEMSWPSAGPTVNPSTGPYCACLWPCTESCPPPSNNFPAWSPFPFQIGSQSTATSPSYYISHDSPSYQSSYRSPQYATPSYHSTPSTIPTTSSFPPSSRFTTTGSFDSINTFMPSSEVGSRHYVPIIAPEESYHSGGTYYSSHGIDNIPTQVPSFYPASFPSMRATLESRPTMLSVQTSSNSQPSEYIHRTGSGGAMPSHYASISHQSEYLPSTRYHENVPSQYTPSMPFGMPTDRYSQETGHYSSTYLPNAHSYVSPQHVSTQQGATSFSTIGQEHPMHHAMQHHPRTASMMQSGMSSSSSCMPCMPCPYCYANNDVPVPSSDYVARTMVVSAAENSAVDLKEKVAKVKSPVEKAAPQKDKDISQASLEPGKTSGEDNPIWKAESDHLPRSSRSNISSSRLPGGKTRKLKIAGCSQCNRYSSRSGRSNLDEGLSWLPSLGTEGCNIPSSARSLDGLLRKDGSCGEKECSSVSCSRSKSPEEYQPVARVPQKWEDNLYPFQSFRSVESELHKCGRHQLPKVVYREPYLSKILVDLGISESNRAAYRGEWIGSGDVVEAIDPATSTKIASVVLPTSQEVEHCIQEAKGAAEVWMNLQSPCRSVILHEIARRVLAKLGPLAKLLSLEVGKVSVDAMCEVRGVVHMFEYAAGLASTLSGNVFESERPNHIILERFLPMGTTGILAAFNTPYSTFGKSASLSLAVGNSVIFKPAPTTALSSIALMKIVGETFKIFGLPPVVTCIQGGSDVGRVIAEDERIDVVAFSGTMVSGHDVGMRVQNRFGKSLLNLSGNNSMIVSHDANFELALQAATLGIVDFAGQKKQKISHIIVHRLLYSQFVEELSKMLQKVTKFCGHPLDPQSIFGPLHCKEITDDYLDIVQLIKAAGGKIEIGGGEIMGNFVEPSIVTNLSSKSDLVARPMIGPLAFVFPASDIEEAIEINNSFSNRVNSSVFTKNVIDVYRFIGARGLAGGVISVNTANTGTELTVPLGGDRAAGGGRLSGSNMWREYCRRVAVNLNFSSRLPYAHGSSSIHAGGSRIY